MSRFRLLFGTRLAPKAPLRFNILLKHLFVCQVFPLFLVFLNDFVPISPDPAVPLHHQPLRLLSRRPRLAFLRSVDGRRGGGMSDSPS